MPSDHNKEVKDVAHEHSLSPCDYCDKSISLDPMTLLGTLSTYAAVEPIDRPFLIKNGVKIVL